MITNATYCPTNKLNNWEFRIRQGLFRCSSPHLMPVYDDDIFAFASAQVYLLFIVQIDDDDKSLSAFLVTIIRYNIFNVQ